MHLLNSIKSYRSEFWLINALQFVEKLAYTSMLWQMPIYIAQKNIEGGLQWGQEIKGTIFLVWAIVQNITPIFTGGLPIKFGYKKVFIFAFVLIFFGYMGLATQKEIIPFTISVLIIGVGSGILVPTIQGSLASIMNYKNQASGWGIYFMLINISVLIGGILSKYIKNLGWEILFLFSAIMTLLNLIIILILFKNKIHNTTYNLKNIFTDGLMILKEKPVLAKFLFFMAGFTIVYMQFYETLPNFIVDWTDSSSIVFSFSLPEFMLMDTPLGKMLSYEWLLNINSILIILFVVFISSYVFPQKNIKSIIVGIILASIGLIICSSTMLGSVLVIGIIIYTFGEMLVNPRFHKFFAIVSPLEYKSIYMSFIKISFAIGLGLGGILGGIVYKHLGEKASLAQAYLLDKFNLDTSINDSFLKLQELLKLDALSATKLLWDYYHPYVVFYPFAIIGLLSVIGLFSIRKKIFQNNN